MKNFSAGNISNSYENWMKITKDKLILELVRDGLKFEFTEIPPECHIKPLSLKPYEENIIDNEVLKLLDKQVLSVSFYEPNEFVSSVFTRRKKDGAHRMILNLKHLNKYVSYKHFKMESLQNVIDIIQPHCWMASVDLKDAFYSIHVNESYQKFFKFNWKGKLYKYLGMPNGYGEAMRTFTKLLRVPFGILRSKGYLSVVFVDDTYLQADCRSKCLDNIQATISLLRSLGFTIHADKSILEPTQQIEFLGFIIDSSQMTIKLSEKKTNVLKNKIKSFLAHQKRTIRELASVIGYLISCFPAEPLGKLHYRSLEQFKTSQLRLSKGKFDAKLSPIPLEGYLELKWWLEHIDKSIHRIKMPKVDLVIKTDASELGWGATDGTTPTGGRWGTTEYSHINLLELKAIYLALCSYVRSPNRHQHVQIQSDSTVAISYVNNMGGKITNLNNLAITIWDYCISQDCWITATHIPGKCNIVADRMSREFDVNTEWSLSIQIFQHVLRHFDFFPDIDLFATRLNYKIDKYASWLPDPGATVVDAFSIPWTGLKFYAYPPFSLVGKVISKIIQENTHGIMIIPVWPTQHWFPLVMKHLIHYPLLLPKASSTICLPFDTKLKHPMASTLQLAAVLVSSMRSEIITFQQKLMTSSCIHGDREPFPSITQYYNVGKSFVMDRMQIPCVRM